MKTILNSLFVAAALCLASPGLNAQTATPTPTPTASPDYIAQLRTSPTAALTSAPFIAARTAAAVPMITSQLFQTISTFAHALWLHPETAQATVDSLGEKAAPLFIAYGEFAGPLAVIDPAAYARLPQVPAGYTWAILPAQADGTWLVGQRSVLITYTAPPAATPTPTP